MMRICGVLAVVLGIASCSSDSDELKDDDVDSLAELTIEFSPMYSAFIDDDHPCSVPAFVENHAANVKWAASDESMVALEPTARSVTITTKKAGSVDIVASTGSVSAKSLLTITPFTAAEWDAGSQRFHNGIEYVAPTEKQVALWTEQRAMEDGGTDVASDVPIVVPAQDDAACDNCHGEDLRGPPFFPIAITPQQIGGYSADDLAQIIARGRKPDGAQVSIPSPPPSQANHTWDAIDPSDDSTRSGIIAYLRSLAPKARIVPYAGATPDP